MIDFIWGLAWGVFIGSILQTLVLILSYKYEGINAIEEICGDGHE